MPSQSSSLGVFKSFGRYSFLSVGWLFRFFVRHWYITIFLIIVLPSIIGAFNTAVETRNPAHFLLPVGEKVLAGDYALKQDTILLAEEGVDSFVGFEKPTEGYWEKTKYWWFFFWNLLFRFFGNLWLIFMPYIATYKIYKYSTNVSEVSKPAKFALIFFIIYLFIVNVLFVSIDGGLTYPTDATFYQKAWIFLQETPPLKGVYTFIKFLVFKTV